MDRDDIRERTDAPAAYQTRRRRDDEQERHHAHERQNLRQNQVVGAVDAHDLHRIDLLRDTHRADLRSDVRTNLTRQNKT